MTDLLASILYEDWILHALIWLPLVGTAHVLLTSADRAKNIAFRWSALVFVLSLGLWWSFDPGDGGFSMVSTAPWIESWGVSYSLGIDGISVFMVLLTTFTSAIAILGSFEYVKTRRKAFYALMLLLEMGVVGFFLATDIFLFYVFFELTLVPMYFIVGIWGGRRRIYAAIKFFLYTAVGSLLMLVAILYVYFSSGTGSFGYDAFMNAGLSLREQLWLFAAFALAFGIKVPVFPLHTWLPDAHVEAPTPGSVILASVLLKMGTYGFLRFLLPFFPEASRHPVVVMVMLVLGVVGIIYAAWVAAVQPDGKKLVAYTSVAHMGFVVIGIFALTLNGLQGGMVVMISHGISTGALFLLLGMMYERRHTQAHRGLRRDRPGGALVRHRLRDHRAGLDRAARHERVRRRVPGAARCLRDPHGGGRDRRPRRHLRGLLHAADGAADPLQQAGQSREPHLRRPLPARDGDHGPPGRADDLDRGASHPLPAAHGTEHRGGAGEGGGGTARGSGDD